MGGSPKRWGEPIDGSAGPTLSEGETERRLGESILHRSKCKETF